MKRNDQFADDAVIGLNTAGAQGKGRRKVMRLIEIALLAFGIVLAGFFVAARIDSVVVSQEALKSFEAAPPIPAPPAAAGSPETNWPAPDFSAWDQQRVRAYERAAGNRTGAPIAVLEIPKFGLMAPVLEGTDGLTLNHGGRAHRRHCMARGTGKHRTCRTSRRIATVPRQLSLKRVHEIERVQRFPGEKAAFTALLTHLQVHLKKPGNLPGFSLPSEFDLYLKLLVEVAHRA